MRQLPIHSYGNDGEVIGGRRGFRGRLRWSWRAILTIAILATIIATGASPFIVRQTSMVATITPGEVLLVDRLTTGMYARGEIVVFRAPIPGYAGDPFTKRVIGLPGERLVMRSGRVFINGRYLPEPYVHYDRRPAEGTTLSITVPPDSVFVLGDHRDVSWDSREYGSIPLRLIIGRAWLGLAFPFRAQLLVAPAY